MDQGSRIGREGSEEGREGSTSTAVLSLSNPGQHSHSALSEKGEAETERRENQLREFIKDQHPEWSFEEIEREVVAVKAAVKAQKHVATVKPKHDLERFKR